MPGSVAPRKTGRRQRAYDPVFSELGIVDTLNLDPSTRIRVDRIIDILRDRTRRNSRCSAPISFDPLTTTAHPELIITHPGTTTSNHSSPRSNPPSNSKRTTHPASHTPSPAPRTTVHTTRHDYLAGRNRNRSIRDCPRR